MKVLLLLVLLTIFSTASAGLCSELKKSKRIKQSKNEKLEICVDTSSECSVSWDRTAHWNLDSGRGLCEEFGMRCVKQYKVRFGSDPCDFASKGEPQGCDKPEWTSSSPNVVTCAPGPPEKMKYFGPPMAAGQIRPAPLSTGADVANCLNDVPSSWISLGNGIQGRTVSANVGGKRFVQLKYALDGTPVDTMSDENRLHDSGPKPRVFINLVDEINKRFGILWVDKVASKIHLEWFKICDRNYHESHVLSDSFMGDELILSAADIDKKTNTIYLILLKQNAADMKGGKIYKLSTELKIQKSRDLCLKDQNGCIDFKKGYNDPGLIKYHEGKLFIELIRGKFSNHQGAAVFVYDANTLDTDGEKKDPGELGSCDHCFGNTLMFIANDGKLVYSNMADFEMRGVTMMNIYKDPEDGWQIKKRNVYTSQAANNRIQNKVYTREGTIIETPDGFLVSLHGQATHFDTKFTNDGSKKMSYNVATILVNKGIFDHSEYYLWTPKSVIESTAWSNYERENEGGIRTNGEPYEQRIVGTNWITDYTDAFADNAVNVKTVSNGNEFYLLYEKWSKKMGTLQEKHIFNDVVMQKIDSKGIKQGEPVSLGNSFRLGQKCEFLTIDSIYMNVNGIGQDGSSGALLMNLLIPLDGNSQPAPQPIQPQPVTPIAPIQPQPNTPVAPIQPQPTPVAPVTPVSPPVSNVEDEWSSSRCEKIAKRGRCSRGKNQEKCAKTCGGSGGSSPPSSGGSNNKSSGDSEDGSSGGRNKRGGRGGGKKKDKKKRKKKRRAEEEITVGATENNAYAEDLSFVSEVKTFVFGAMCGAAFLAVFNSREKSKNTEYSALLQDDRA